MVQKFQAHLDEVRDLSPTVKHFTFSYSEPFEFKAGQFVNLSFEHDGETLRRPYSIASSPNFGDKKLLELCIKLVDGGQVTPRLWEKQAGETFELMGPLGVFGLEKAEDAEKELVFIGTGTGVAPLRSMIYDELESQELAQRDLEEKETDSVNAYRNLTLIFGVRYEEELLYVKEFQKLSELHPNFKFVPIVSRPTQNWSGRTGHVQQNFDVIDPNNSYCFICGLPAMFDGAKAKLLDLGIPQEHIFHEVFR